MERKTPFHNPMSFAAELNSAGYLTRPPGQSTTRPGYTPPSGTTRPPGQSIKPPWTPRPGAGPRPGNPTRPPGGTIVLPPRDKASLADQAIAARQGRFRGGIRPPAFAKGYQYGARIGRGGRIPVSDQADLQRRVMDRERNNMMNARLTPFIPPGG